MFNDTVTIFNRLHSKNGDKWYPHVLHNVKVNADKSSIIAKYGAESTDTASLIVHYKHVDGEKMIDGIRFLPPKEWTRQEEGMHGDSITFNDNATYFDFFIMGEWGNSEPINDNDYDKGFYNELNSKLDYCYAITSVGCFNIIPHFEIMAK